MLQKAYLLVADANASVREVVSIAVTEAGWHCYDACDGIAALKLMRRVPFQLVIIEAELPQVDGLTVCRQLRKSSAIPVIFIASNGKESDRLAAFAAGGNDYLTKPFYPRELVARCKSLLSLYQQGAVSVNTITMGGITIEGTSRVVTISNKRIALTPKEYDLLVFFTSHPKQAFSRSNLLDLVWGAEFEGGDRTVDTHVKSLRSKIRPWQHMIETVWGFGYKFEPDD